ncbi:MAG: alcohol dehydrogenase catalytic domain-containing protein [Deferribacterota bacterium]|nr:alcohol dehydrogenase catalytic domain-containing protein [Deferribacterota bacterium]
MKAYILDGVVSNIEKLSEHLYIHELEKPECGDEEILIKVEACGICHTDLDEIEGRLIPTKLPIVLGHQIVGRVAEKGKSVDRFNIGDRVGVGWINKACGVCYFCKNKLENLCDNFVSTGKDVDGGYAEYTKVHKDYALLMPEGFDSYLAAPLLCAGGVGFRSLRLTNIRDGQKLALTGFGASGHLVLQTAKFLYPNLEVFVFARNKKQREHAMQLGADGAFDYNEPFNNKVNAVIDTTPVWRPIIHALGILEKSGRLVINAIRKEDSDKELLKNLDYNLHLWQEKEIKSVANVTKSDIEEFLRIAALIPINPTVEIYDFKDLVKALKELRKGIIRGSKVLKIN